ncbi:MAG: hypothetical protein U1F49_14055 [Rubrivivax sp.]
MEDGDAGLGVALGEERDARRIVLGQVIGLPGTLTVTGTALPFSTSSAMLSCTRPVRGTRRR